MKFPSSILPKKAASIPSRTGFIDSGDSHRPASCDQFLENSLGIWVQHIAVNTHSREFDDSDLVPNLKFAGTRIVSHLRVSQLALKTRRKARK
jgi:hypothetical protein